MAGSLKDGSRCFRWLKGDLGLARTFVRPITTTQNRNSLAARSV